MTDLATEADLVARLGRALTAAELLKTPAMLTDASALIRGYCRRDFTSNANEVAKLRPIAGELRLPHKPVVNVDQVEQIGTSGTPNRVMAVTEWSFDGIDTICLWPWLPVSGYLPPTGTYADTYKITYDNGGTVPVFIVGRCCTMVLRTLIAPTPIEGLTQERIGQYAYQYGQFPGGQSPGPTVVMTKADKTALREAGYRSSAFTVQLRL